MKNLFLVATCSLGILALLSSPVFATSFSTGASYAIDGISSATTGSNNANLSASSDRQNSFQLKASADANSEGILTTNSSANFDYANPGSWEQNSDTRSRDFNLSATSRWSNTYSIEQSGFYAWQLQLPDVHLGVTSKIEDDALDYINWVEDPATREHAIDVFSDSYNIIAKVMGEVLVDDKQVGNYGAQVDFGGMTITGALSEDNYEVESAAPWDMAFSWKDVVLSFDLGWLDAGEDVDVTMLLSSSVSGMGFMNSGEAYISDPGNPQLSRGRTPVPEPGTVLLFGVGLAGLVSRFRKK